MCGFVHDSFSFLDVIVLVGAFGIQITTVLYSYSAFVRDLFIVVSLSVGQFEISSLFALNHVGLVVFLLDLHFNLGSAVPPLVFPLLSLIDYILSVHCLLECRWESFAIGSLVAALGEPLRFAAFWLQKIN
jgi:hypothetical protein